MTASEHPHTVHGPRWRRAIVASSVVCSLVVGGIVMLPTVLNQTQYRDRALQTAFAKYGLTGSSKVATGGWLVPLGYRQIELTDDNGRVKVTVEEVRTTRSLLGLISSGADLGTLTLVNPVVEIALDDEGNFPLARPDGPTSFEADLAFAVENGTFRLSVPWRKLPIVDLDGLNVRGAVGQRDDGRWLTVDPVHVLDRQRVSEAHAEQNLALIAPVLSQTTRVTGEASVWLDGVELRLDPTEKPFSPFPLTGRAEFHHVEARLRPEWATQISRIIGLMSNPGIPDRLEVVRNSVVDFQITDAGIHHSGLAILLPDVANGLHVNSSGVVGFDETLDLVLAVQLPGMPAGRGALLSMLTKVVAGPLSMRVTGTVSEPVLVPPSGGSWLDEMSLKIAPDQHSPEPPTVQQAVFELIQTGAGAQADPAAHESLPGSILGLIRAVTATSEGAPKEGSLRQRRLEKRRLRKLQRQEAAPAPLE